MRALIQRVSRAQVTVDQKVIGKIDRGVVVLLGIRNGDTEKNAEQLVEKVLNLRIFPDQNGKFDRSVMDVKGALLVVSQFTLYGDCSKGRRPSFSEAAPPPQAEELYKKVVQLFHNSGLAIETGQFQAMMEVELVNDGPVTLLVEC